MRNGVNGYLEVVKVRCDSLNGGHSTLHKVCHSLGVVFLQVTLDAERANRTSVTYGYICTISPHNRHQRPHLRLHVIFDVDLVGFFGELGWLEVVVEDDVDVCDGAFFRALLQLLSRGIGSNQSAIDPIVFSGHPLDKGQETPRTRFQQISIGW